MKRLEEISESLGKLPRAEQDQFRAFARREADRHPSPVVAGEIETLVDGLLPDAEE